MKKFLILLISSITISTASLANEHYFNGMNEIYKKLSETHKNNPEYLQKLKIAQSKLKEFLIAQSELIYMNHNGSLSAMCIDSYKSTLDIVIANETRYLFHLQEGDSCTGI
jgi:hypothetical protein